MTNEMKKDTIMRKRCVAILVTSLPCRSRSDLNLTYLDLL